MKTIAMVHFLLPGLYSTMDDMTSSNLASVRLRAAVAAKRLVEEGWRVTFGDMLVSDADLLIIGKIGASDVPARSARWLSSIQKVRSRGGKILLDYTDHHLGFESPMSGFYRAAAPLADVIVCPSEHMSELVAEYVACQRIVIPEPIEVPILPTRSGTAVAGVPVRLLWFGHASNIAYLIRWVEARSRKAKPIELFVLSNTAGLQMFQSQTRYNTAVKEVYLDEWSVERMLEAARHCDACVIPSDLDDPRKCGASPNRLVTALAMGLPTAATALPSYRPFSEFFMDLVSPDFDDWVMEPQQHLPRVARFQTEALPGFSVETVSETWVDACSSFSR